MNDETLDREADERARLLIMGAWTSEARPGHREKVLAAMDAAAEERAGAEAKTKLAESKPARKIRRVWPSVVLVVVAVAAAALLLLHTRDHPQSVKPPGTVWDQNPTPAAPLPPPPR